MRFAKVVAPHNVRTAKRERVGSRLDGPGQRGRNDRGPVNVIKLASRKNRAVNHHIKSSAAVAISNSGPRVSNTVINPTAAPAAAGRFPRPPAERPRDATDARANRRAFSKLFRHPWTCPCRL